MIEIGFASDYFEPMTFNGLIIPGYTLVLEAAHGRHEKGTCWRLMQKSNRHQSSERQPAYSVVLKDRFGQSKP